METTLRVLVILCAVLFSACDDGEKKEDPPVEFDPYTETAHVRVLHLAPGLASVSVELDVPSNRFRVEEEMPVRVGEPTLRSVTPDAPLAYTAYTPTFFHVPTPEARIDVLQSSASVADNTFDSLTPGDAHYAVIVESNDVVGVELLPVWRPETDAEGNPVQDGQARVGLFQADPGLGTFDVALQATDGPDTAQWPGVAFGTTTLDAPSELAPGAYELVIQTAGGDPVPVLAPEQGVHGRWPRPVRGPGRSAG